MSKIEEVKKYAVDGREFTSKAEAEAFVKSGPRREAILAAATAGKLNVANTLYGDSLVDFLAANGDVLVAALTIKAERKPRKVKDAPPADGAAA